MPQLGTRLVHVATILTAVLAMMITGLAGPASAVPPGGPPDPPPESCLDAPCHVGPDNPTFKWELDKLRAASDGSVQEANYDTTNESTTSTVYLDACASTARAGILSYTWSFSSGAQSFSTTKCSTTWQRPVTHSLTSVVVTLTVRPAGGGAGLSTARTVTYRDIVIASLGDSAASGQGASEIIGHGKPAFVASQACDRSGLAASAQAALRIQNDQTNLPNTTVHFWHLACSGARISAADSSYWGPPEDEGGMLDPYTAVDHAVARPGLPSQISRLRTLKAQSGLPIDRLLMTIGANETGWGAVASECLNWTGLIPDYGSAAQVQCLGKEVPHINDGLASLPGHFDKLNQAIPDTLVPRGNIYLTDYYDPLDSLGSPMASGICGGEIIVTPQLWTYGAKTVEPQLQADVQNAANKYHWHFVSGIRQAFQGHGVCQLNPSTRWVNSATDSMNNQGDHNGSWHPNQTGQTKVADFVYNAISPGLPATAPFTDALLDTSSGTPKLYVTKLDGHLWENYYNPTAAKWLWTDHGVPAPGVSVVSAPGALLATEGKFFVAGSDGHLWENYWSQAAGKWLWTDHGQPAPGVAVVSAPGAALVQEDKFFMAGSDGHLWENYYNPTAAKWLWTDHGVPAPGVSVVSAPGALLATEGKFFVAGSDGHLWENYWSQAAGKWLWTDHGQPAPGVAIVSAPGAALVQEDKFFMAGSDGHLWENYYNPTAAKWLWTDHGVPAPGVSVVSAPGALLATEGKFFVAGSDGHLWENYWSQAAGKWLWTDHGQPAPGVAIVSAPGAALVQEDKFFMAGSDGHLWENYYNPTAAKWLWTDHGSPI